MKCECCGQNLIPLWRRLQDEATKYRNKIMEDYHNEIVKSLEDRKKIKGLTTFMK
ncbi:hypothetical protein LCGC14_0454090 [marine sediment metagenome]|uniref:Uncharacterized protein n=1 Tax=marine sediment metagenome TaxID=412755 RepID=A0A0F9SM54_9ZZZZ